MVNEMEMIDLERLALVYPKSVKLTGRQYTLEALVIQELLDHSIKASLDLEAKRLEEKVTYSLTEKGKQALWEYYQGEVGLVSDDPAARNFCQHFLLELKDDRR